MTEFVGFPKVPRLRRSMVITEKLDGTNAQVCIVPVEVLPRSVTGQIDGTAMPCMPIDIDFDRGMAMFAGSRKRYITPDNDNFGFARWALDHAEELYELGPGRHFGEWWGRGIQRGYDLDEKRFSLFNTTRWTEDPTYVEKDFAPGCCHVVPILYEGMFSDHAIHNALRALEHCGSFVTEHGFMDPEGIMVYHTAAHRTFKVTIKNDELPKGAAR